MQKRGTKSLMDSSKQYTKIHPDVSAETKKLIDTIMFEEKLLLWQVIEKAIHQYSKPTAVALKPQKTSAPKPSKTLPAPFALDSERQCKICESVKSLDDYYLSNKTTGTRQLHCKACEIEKKKKQRSLRNLKK